jgi:hypothetical protein
MAKTKNEILQDIKVFFGLAEAASPTYTLADGTPIEASALEVGGSVMIGGAAAPAGDYTLSDGQTLTVDESGIITAVNPAVAPAGTPEVPMAVTPEMAQAAFLKFAAGTPEERLANLEIVARALFESTFGWELREQTQKAIRDQAINVYKTAMAEHEAKENKNSDAIVKMVALLEEVLKTPTTTAEAPKQTFTKQQPESKNEKFARIAKTLETLKN